MIASHPRVVRPNVDTKVYDLAEHFLKDGKHTTDDVWALSAAIQNAVDGWFGEACCPICGGLFECKPGCHDGSEPL